jgi:ADP-heptose:LPS heptosyltransferase
MVPEPDPPVAGRFPLWDPAVRRVAVVRLRVGLGDLLCSAPALRELAAFRPDVEVTVVTWAAMADVVQRLGHVHDLLPFPGIDGIPDRAPDPATWPAAWERFTAAAHEREFDLALQAYGNNPTANLVTAALGARRVGGFAPTGWRPERDPELHLPYPDTEHEVDRHLLLLERLGLPLHPGSGRMELPLSADEEQAHASRLQALGLAAGTYAVLHPGASSPSRRWPVPAYAEVAGRLGEAGLTVVVTGSAGERPLVDELRATARVPVLDLCDRTDLAGLALLLRDAAVLVGNDTGTAHLAEAVGARSVTVLQPGDPRRWAHRGPRSRALTPGVPCAPCPHLDCPIDFPCSRATTPDRVMGAVRELLPLGTG